MQSVMENMKIQENYFYKLDNLKEVKVIWKKYDKANILEIGIEYPTAIVDLDRLTGIKITEEWLLKFGFKETKEDKKLKWFSKDRLDIVLGEDNFIVFDHLVLKHLKCVHQLQNLYFSLTARELTVA